MSDHDSFLRAKAERIKQRYGTQQQNTANPIKINTPTIPKKETQKPFDFNLEELLQKQSSACFQRYRRIISSDYDLKKQEMKRTSIREPTKRDIEWHLLCDEALRVEMDRNMKSYREILLFQAGFVLDEGKQKTGLGILLNLCYVDMNGPDDAGFNSSKAGFAPGILDLIEMISHNLNLKKEDVHKLFLDQNKFQQAPLPLDRAWELFEQRMISENIF